MANKEETRADKIKKCFRQFDIDGNGTICLRELKDVVKKLCGPGQHVSDREIDMCMKRADSNGNGVIEYSEFVDWLMQPGALVNPTTHGIEVFDLGKVLRPLFDVFDRDGSGFVSQEEYDEVHTIISNSLKLSPDAKDAKRGRNPRMLTRQSQSVFDDIDLDKDHQISFKEFVEFQRQSFAKCGLRSEDLAELVPSLSRQLIRVFKLCESDAKGELKDVDTKVLQRIISNISNISRDIYNDDQSGKFTYAGRKHFTNRWTEPPVGMNIERVKRMHLKLSPLPMIGVQEFDVITHCIPEEMLENRDNLPRMWYARMGRKVLYKNGRTMMEEPQFYVFEDLNWTQLSSSKEYTEAYDTLAPELRFFCLLKTEANFGIKMSLDSIDRAMTSGVILNLITQDIVDKWNEHLLKEVYRMMTQDDAARADMARDGSFEEDQVSKFREKVRYAPRGVMAELSEIGVFKISSVWADFINIS